MPVKFKGLDETLDFFSEVDDSIENSISQALVDGALLVENSAKRSTPVDTGRLRDSITTNKIDKLTVEIGTNVDYAEAVHEGWRGRSPKPFMKQGYAQSKNKIISNIENAISKGLK